MTKQIVLTVLAIVVLISLMQGPVHSEEPAPSQSPSLEQGFVSPPDSAKPYTWWHWVNGNVSKEGITKDLEAMKAVGIGGFQQFDVGLPITVGPVVYNSPKFHELMAFTIAESQRLGLAAGFNNCSGWSSSGGPWITPENSMKTLVWSETEVRGDDPKSRVLPLPHRADGQKKKNTAQEYDYYRDVAVLAFCTPENTQYRIDHWQEKSLFNPDSNAEHFHPDHQQAPPGCVIAADEVIDLSDQMKPDGTLTWTPRLGDWTVVRFGYTTTSAHNKPGSRGAIGLELDKLSRKAADVHWDALVNNVIADAGGKPALTTVLIDSYEVGMQNWTDEFAVKFQQRRGYDLIPMLLCMTGRVVDSAETTERVLWDVRSTVSELMHENYFGYFAEKCHDHRLKLAIEPYGTGSFDAPATTLLADIPMTEFWQNPPRNLWQWTSQIVPSGAHLSGRSIVGAESFTAIKGDWTASPAGLKAWGDRAFATGVNRYYFHTFAHQPWNDAVMPGMSMGRFGGNFHRNNTWFMKSREWMEYIARCQFMMQSGTYQADVLALYGDERGFNNFLGARERPDMQPLTGLNFDLGGMSSLDNLSVDSSGDIRVTYDGKILETRYKLLVLKRAELMLPQHVAKLGFLADQGAKIFAPKPLHSPSWSQHGESDKALRSLVKRYWDSGKIGSIKDFDAAVAALVPDCQAPDSILFNRHRIDEDDVYFLSHQKETALNTTVVFRVGGKQPELWNPVTGQISDAPNWKTLADGRTEVRLNFDALDSMFVVFRKQTTSRENATPIPKLKELLFLNDDWTVTFDPQWGPRESFKLERLAAWNESSDDSVRFFSGTARYHTLFELDQNDQSLVLDLGQVGVLARVTLNGRDLGTLWKSPFRVDITNAAQQGTNELEVEVTNLWVNRLIGDERFGKSIKQTPLLSAGKVPPSNSARKTIVAHSHHKKNDALQPSGLIGPVKILQGSR